jgi:hypothetical protein
MLVNAKGYRMTIHATQATGTSGPPVAREQAALPASAATTFGATTPAGQTIERTTEIQTGTTQG